jgi:nucleotide-binding universal stress UspA family protein
MSGHSETTQLSTVLVGVDGTPAGDAALAWALQEARIHQAAVESFVVWSTQIAKIAHVGFDELTERSARHLLEESLDHVGGPGGIEVRLQTRVGPPFSELEFEAAATHAILTVVGNHPHGVLHDALLGVTTTALTRHARCPLVLVSPGPLRPGDGSIVVGVDGSAESLAALRWALEEAAVRHQPVRAVRAYRPRSHVTDRPVEEGRLLDELLQTIAANAKAGVEVDAEVVRGPTAQVLVGRSSDTELLVLGASARRNLVELIVGSEIRACARATRVPLVLVPRALDDSRVPTGSPSGGPR